MALRGFEKRLLEALRVSCAHAEFGELEAEQVEKMEHAGANGDGLSFDGASGDDGGDQALSGCIVFDEGGVGGEGSLQFFEGEIGGACESGVFAFVRGQLAKSAQELIFVRDGCFLELLKAPGGGL